MPVRAEQRIYRTRPNGARELAAPAGALLSDELAVELGLLPASALKSPARAPKAEPEKPKRAASRDQQLSKP